MRFEQKLQVRIALGYVVMLVVGIIMIAIMLHERKRIHKIEAETEDIRQVSRDINTVHRRITRLTLLGEGVIGWDEADRRPTSACRQPAASLETPMHGVCAYGTDRHAPLAIGRQGSPPAAHRRSGGTARGRGQPLGEPLARRGEACHPCAHRHTEKERHCGILRRQENRTGVPFCQRIA